MAVPRTPLARRDREMRTLFPRSMATSVVVMAVDTGSWAAAFAVPGVSAILSPGADWTPEGLFVVVALTVQTALGQARILEGWEPHLAGPGRWAAASGTAAMVTTGAFGASAVGWATLGVCAMIALIARAVMVCVVLLLRGPCFVGWLPARPGCRRPRGAPRSSSSGRTLSIADRRPAAHGPKADVHSGGATEACQQGQNPANGRALPGLTYDPARAGDGGE